MTEILFPTREAWLTAAIDELRPLFTDLPEGSPGLPGTIHVSVGFGYNGKAENRHILAQCWARCTSADGAPHIFVSPEIERAEDAAAALLHELAHAADDCEHDHRGRFVQIGKVIGLEGKPTQMLPSALDMILCTKALGPYPHARLDVKATRARVPVPAGEAGSEAPELPPVHTGPSRQENRHVKCWCDNEHCDHRGYAMRATRSTIAVAVPVCPVCLAAMAVTPPKEA